MRCNKVFPKVNGMPNLLQHYNAILNQGNCLFSLVPWFVVKLGWKCIPKIHLIIDHGSTMDSHSNYVWFTKLMAKL